MDCPNCGLINPSKANRCDCGYDFVTSNLKQSYVALYEQEKRAVIIPRSPPRAVRILSLVFAVIRALRRVRSFVFFGVEPPWARQLYPVLGAVNVFGVVPTVTVMAVSPQHFFRRVRADGSTFNGVYKPPITFLTSAIAGLSLLVAKGAATANLSLQTERLKSILMVVAIGTPLWLFTATVFAYVIYHWGFVPWWFKRINSTVTRLDGRMVSTILSPRTYLRLHWPSFVWMICYFSVYVYAALVVVIGVTMLAYLPLAFLFAFSYGESTAALMLFLSLNTVAVIAFQRLVLYPYSILLDVAADRVRGRVPLKAHAAAMP